MAEQFESGIELTDDGGVVKEILVEGSGDSPPNNVEVSVHYVGTLLDGSKFDSSRDRNEFFKFQLGAGRVIKGWDIGVASMKKGEKCILTCKSEYAYGENGSPPKIPGGATLKFEVELFDWSEEKLTTDGFITKVEVLKEGDGYQSPNDGAVCKVKVKAAIASSGHVFHPEQEGEFTVGEDETLPYGFNTIMKRMKKGEHTIYRIKPNTEFHYDTSFQALPAGVSETDELLLDVEMLDFTRAKEAWQMDNAEKVQHAENIKKKGNDMFAAKRFSAAAKKYENVVSTLENLSDANEDEQKEVDALLVAAWNNLAMLQLNDKKYADVIRNATKVLDIEAKNTKALFRRSKAHANNGNYEKAVADCKTALAFDKDNKAFIAHHRVVKQRMNAERKKAKAIYSKMFASAPKKQRRESDVKIAKEVDAAMTDDQSEEPKVEEAN